MTKPPNRPGGRPAQAASGDSTPAKSASTLPPPRRPRHPEAALPAYALLTTTYEGRARRQVYLTLHAANAAMDRAKMRGQRCELVLVKLVPVPSLKPPKKAGGTKR